MLFDSVWSEKWITKWHTKKPHEFSFSNNDWLRCDHYCNNILFVSGFICDWLCPFRCMTIGVHSNSIWRRMVLRVLSTAVRSALLSSSLSMRKKSTRSVPFCFHSHLDLDTKVQAIDTKVQGIDKKIQASRSWKVSATVLDYQASSCENPLAWKNYYLPRIQPLSFPKKC